MLRERGAPDGRRPLRHTRVTCVRTPAPCPVTAPRRRMTDCSSSPGSSPRCRSVAVGRRLPARSQPTQRREKKRLSRPADIISRRVSRAAVRERLRSEPASKPEAIPRAEVGGLIPVLNTSPLKRSVATTSSRRATRGVHFPFPSCPRFPGGFNSPASARPRAPRSKSH